MLKALTANALAWLSRVSIHLRCSPCLSYSLRMTASDLGTASRNVCGVSDGGRGPAASSSAQPKRTSLPNRLIEVAAPAGIPARTGLFRHARCRRTRSCLGGAAAASSC